MNSVLIVDDNVHLIALLGKMLEPIAQVSFATSGAAALAQMRSHLPDLLLLDAEMPGMSGHAVCKLMKADPELEEIPVIFVTAHNDAEAEVQAFDAGAVDFISKPVNEAVLLARVGTQLRLKCLTDKLRRSALVDGLTGLANRTCFDQRLTLEWSRAMRSGAPLSLILLDVDHFKKYNDHYGHPAGDGCLREVAGAIAGQARRPADVAARVGGEEFTLLLPDTDAAGALEIAERVKTAVAGLDIAHATSATARHVTASLGVATCQPMRSGPLNAQDLVELADRGLYAAKSQGRNCTAVAPLQTQRIDPAASPVAMPLI